MFGSVGKFTPTMLVHRKKLHIEDDDLQVSSDGSQLDLLQHGEETLGPKKNDFIIKQQSKLKSTIQRTGNANIYSNVKRTAKRTDLSHLNNPMLLTHHSRNRNILLMNVQKQNDEITINLCRVNGSKIRKKLTKVLCTLNYFVQRFRQGQYITI